MKTKIIIGAVYEGLENDLYIYLGNKGNSHFFYPINKGQAIYTAIDTEYLMFFPKETIAFSDFPCFRLIKSFKNYKKDGIKIGDTILIKGEKQLYLGRRNHPGCVLGFGYAFLPFKPKNKMHPDVASFLSLPDCAFVLGKIDNIE